MMKRHLILLALIGASTLAAAADKITDFVKPGQWTYESAVAPDGKNWMGLQVSQGCLKAEDAVQWRAKVEAQMDEGQCTPTNLVVRGGVIRGQVTCKEMPPGAVATIEGTYTDDSYSVITTMRAVVGGREAVLRTRWKGERTGGC